MTSLDKATRDARPRPQTVRAPTAADFGWLAVLSLLFSLSNLWTKIAIAEFPPMTLAALRIGIATLVLMAFMPVYRLQWPRGPRIWGRYMAIAFFAGAAPGTLLGWAAFRLDSGMMAILAGALPLAGMIVMHWGTHDEKITGRKLIGVAMGFGGLLIVIGPSALGGLGQDLVAQLAAVAAVFMWAVSNLLIRWTSAAHPIVFSSAMGVAGLVWLVPALLMFEAPWTLAPSIGGWTVVTVAGLSAAVMGLIVRHLIVHVGGTFPTWNGYISPPLAVVWGAIFLGERLPVEAFVALGFILIGVAVANWRRA